MLLSPSEQVRSGAHLRARFNFISLALLVRVNELELMRKINEANTGFQVTQIEYDNFYTPAVPEGTIHINVLQDTTVQDILDKIARAISSFWTITSANVTAVELDVPSFAPSTQTTISLASIAVIGLVGLVLVRRFS